jgi:putative ABC transport system substrate-binding protein
MRRREFIAGLGSAAAWPIAVRAQQANRVRRIGIFMNQAESDPSGRARLMSILQRLRELGWTEGNNARFDVRWSGGDLESYRNNAKELVALSPDVVLAHTSTTLAALLQVTQTIPIVFVGVIDPVGASFVESLARPGGNTTGFVGFEYALATKWLELLREVAPRVTRAAVLRDASFPVGIGQFAAIQAVGPIGIDLSAIDTRDESAIERGLTAFARGSNGGLIVTVSPFATNHPGLMAALAARYKLPAVYPFRYFVAGGGLVSYGPDFDSQYRPAAEYVDRILRGEKPANLPVQTPTKYPLVINLKTASELGLTLPETLLARADEVIQ